MILKRGTVTGSRVGLIERDRLMRKPGSSCRLVRLQTSDSRTIDERQLKRESFGRDVRAQVYYGGQRCRCSGTGRCGRYRIPSRTDGWRGTGRDDRFLGSDQLFFYKSPTTLLKAGVSARIGRAVGNSRQR
jgi:hypothetical protein